jgi:uncharacterized phiE125 gp8 family phage protein
VQLVKIWTSDNVPLDVDEVMLDLRVDSDDDRTTITRMIRAAGDFLEKRTGYVINAGTYRAIFNDWCDLFPCPPTREICRAPFRGLNSISYLAARDDWQGVDVEDFQVSERQKSFLITALSTFDPGIVAPFICVDSIRVEFDAGFDPVDVDSNVSGEPRELEDGLKTLMTMLVGHYYKNRELFEADKIAQIEVGAGSMLGAYRQFW